MQFDKAKSNFSGFTNFLQIDKNSGLVKYDTIVDMWLSVKNTRLDDLAVLDAQKQFTYSQLDFAISMARYKLSSVGVKKGDNVGLFIPTSADFAVWYLATVTLGAVAVIIPDYYTTDELLWSVTKFKIKTVLSTDKFVDKFSGFDGLTVLTDYNSNDTLKESDVSKNDIATIIFTGGVSGKNKGAMLSHGAIMQGALNGCLGYKDVFNQRYFLILPLSHVFGLIRNFLTPLYTGGVVYMCSNMATLYKSIPAFSPSFLVLVPALAEMILKLANRFGSKILGSNLKYVICGGSAVSPEIVKGFDAFGVKVYPGYGLTESSNLVSGNYDSLNRPTSIGLPFFNQQLKIVDGELLLKGENLFSGYYDEPLENKNAFTSDGYFKTGDLVEVDSDGYMYIVGRKKNIIILSNGENVTPSKIEDNFNVLPFVEKATVFEDVDSDGNGIIALKIVPRQGANLSKDDMLESLKQANVLQATHLRVKKFIIE
jgi:long-chain acyl-CoA synthetase